MIEDAVEYETSVFVSFGPRRHKTAFHEGARSVSFLRVKGEDAVVDDLYDFSESSV